MECSCCKKEFSEEDISGTMCYRCEDLYFEAQQEAAEWRKEMEDEDFCGNEDLYVSEW